MSAKRVKYSSQLPLALVKAVAPKSKTVTVYTKTKRPSKKKSYKKRKYSSKKGIMYAPGYADGRLGLVLSPKLNYFIAVLLATDGQVISYRAYHYKSAVKAATYVRGYNYQLLANTANTDEQRQRIATIVSSGTVGNSVTIGDV